MTMRMMRIDEEPEREEAEAEEADSVKVRIKEDEFSRQRLPGEQLAFISECQDCKRTVKFIQTKGKWSGR